MSAVAFQIVIGMERGSEARITAAVTRLLFKFEILLFVEGASRALQMLQITHAHRQVEQSGPHDQPPYVFLIKGKFGFGFMHIGSGMFRFSGIDFPNNRIYLG